MDSDTVDETLRYYSYYTYITRINHFSCTWIVYLLHALVLYKCVFVCDTDMCCHIFVPHIKTLEHKDTDHVSVTQEHKDTIHVRLCHTQRHMHPIVPHTKTLEHKDREIMYLLCVHIVYR